MTVLYLSISAITLLALLGFVLVFRNSTDPR